MAEDKQIGEVKLTNVRLSFADSIFKAKPFKNGEGEPKHNCSFLLGKDSHKAQIDAVKAAIREVAKAKWGDNIPKLKEDKFCLRDGDKEDYDGYEGQMYVSASNSRRPTIVDRDRTPLVAEDGRPYSGCYVNAVIRVWAQDNDYGKRINASLEAIQFARHGDAFSGVKPVDANEAFDDLGEDDDGFVPGAGADDGDSATDLI